MPVRSIARGTEQLVTAPPTATAAHVAEIMDNHSVGSVIVVDDEEPVGIVTDRDLALEIVMKGQDHDALVEEFMTRDLVTVDAEAGVMELSRKMKDSEVRQMPVVEDDGALAGIVTLDDVLVLLEDEMKNVSEVIRSESPPY